MERRNVDVIVGGQYGSEGKGNIISRIARKYDCFVRTGGPNAGHKVLFKNKVYCFRHLPSGCLHSPSADLVLGAGAVIYPPVLHKEIEEAGIDETRIHIHPQAVIIRDSDRADDQMRFMHVATTGQGVGMATIRKIKRDETGLLAMNTPELTRMVCRYVSAFPHGWNAAAKRWSRILVEGTQGTMLSLHHGHWPYVTSRDTTVSGVLSEAGVPPHRVNRVVMVMRTYPIRVQSPADGTSGPMPNEIDWATVARRSGGKYTEEELQAAERTSTTNRQRRVSEFSMDEFLRAYHLNMPSDIALTFTDYMPAEMLWRITSQIVGFAPITLQSHGVGAHNVDWINEQEW